MAFDPGDFSVRVLRGEIKNLDLGELEAALDAEEDGDDRKTAKQAIQQRINALEAEEEEAADEGGPRIMANRFGSEAAESDSADVEGEDDAEAADDAEAGESDQEPHEGGPERAYPAPDSGEVVIYDRAGAGGSSAAPPPITGHETIHLTDDGATPLCEANVGAQARGVRRSSLAETIDECQNCLVV